MKPVRCLDCDYLAGSERTPQWLFVTGRGYCDHEGRRGGPWNVLQEIENPSRMCARFKTRGALSGNRARPACKPKGRIRTMSFNIFDGSK